MKCPKCNHEQPSGDTCAGCGVIFSRYYEVMERRAEERRQAAREKKNRPSGREKRLGRDRRKGSADPGGPDGLSGPDGETAPLPPVPKILIPLLGQAALPWKPVSLAAFMGLSILIGTVLVLQMRADPVTGTSDSFILKILHLVNLVFHEAGHSIFGVFGNRTWTILGGSLNQILIPMIAAVAFWWRREPLGFAFALFWGFENFIDVAVYMADARYLRLDLLGGQGLEAHDWRNLFNHWDLWTKDRLIAQFTRILGWVGMYGSWIWLLRRWLKNR